MQVAWYLVLGFLFLEGVFKLFVRVSAIFHEPLDHPEEHHIRIAGMEFSIE